MFCCLFCYDTPPTRTNLRPHLDHYPPPPGFVSALTYVSLRHHLDQSPPSPVLWFLFQVRPFDPVCWDHKCVEASCESSDALKERNWGRRWSGFPPQELQARAEEQKLSTGDIDDYWFFSLALQTSFNAAKIWRRLRKPTSAVTVKAAREAKSWK